MRGVGVRRRHIVLAFLFALGLITFLDRICLSVAGKRMMEDLSLDAAQFGWVHSVFILSYGLFQVPLGAWADRAGQRAVIAGIVIWWSVFTALTGLAGGFASLLVVRFLFGAGEAGAYPAMTGVVARWFPRGERAMAQGFIWGASRLGGALSPLLVVPIQQAYGWRAAFWVLAVAGIAWAGAWWGWFRNRPAEKAGVSAAELAEIGDEAVRGAGEATPWGVLVRSGQFWTILGMYFFYVWGSWFYFTWMPTYLEKGRGFGEDEMKVYAALPFALGVVSNLLGGVMSDRLTRWRGARIGRVWMVCGSLAVSSLCLLRVAFAEGKGEVVVFLVLGFGVMDLMLPAAWAICLDMGRAHAGAVSGAMNAAGSAGGFFCATAFGYIVQRSGDYNLPLVVIAGMLMVSAGLSLRIRAERTLV